MAILLSFDIDGTLEVGDPPGPITIEMVRRAHESGYLVGSCSDRSLSGQRALWVKHNIPVQFVASKHQLPNVKSQIEADSYFHIGDRDTDRQVADQAGFGFWTMDVGATEPWFTLE